MPDKVLCNWFWGSHGCDLEAGDHTIHECGPNVGDRCSQYDSENKKVRSMLWLVDDEAKTETEIDWEEWRDCNYGFTLEPYNPT